MFLENKKSGSARESKLACPGEDLSHLMKDDIPCGDTCKFNTLVNPFLHVDSMRNKVPQTYPMTARKGLGMEAKYPQIRTSPTCEVHGEKLSVFSL